MAINPEDIDHSAVIASEPATDAVRAEDDDPVSFSTRLALDSDQLSVLFVGKVVGQVPTEGDQYLLARGHEGSEDHGSVLSPTSDGSMGSNVVGRYDRKSLSGAV